MTDDILLLTIGVICGVLGHILGLGGGILVIPFLTEILKVPMHDAIGLSLTAIIATSAFTTPGKIKNGQVAIKLAALLESILLIATFAGAYLSLYIDGNYLKKIFAILMSCIAIMMLNEPKIISYFQRKTQARTDSSKSSRLGGEYWDEEHKKFITYSPENIKILAIICLLTGFLTGMLGIGGGVIIIPALVMLANLPVRIATGTSLYMLGFTASGGTLIYWMSGNIRTAIVIPLILGAYGGSIIARTYLSSIKSDVIKKLLLVILIITGVKMWLS